MTTGDTVKGFIDYKEWDRNPKTILFKKTFAGKQKEVYKPSAILAFGINGFEKFRSFAGMISQDNFTINSGSTGIDTSKIMDTVFLRIAYSGVPLTLYTYKDAKKERFFISEDNSTPRELNYHAYLEYNDDQGKNVLKEQRGYRAQLNYYAIKYQQGNAALIAAIQHSGYTEDDLAQIVNKINGTKNSSPKLLTSRAGARFLAGIAINSSEIIFHEVDFGSGNSSGYSIFPKINLGTDIFINKNVGDVIFRTELSFTGNHADVTGRIPGNSYAIDENIKFNQYIISINPQLLYNFYNTDKTKFYIAGGAALNLNTYSDKTYNVYFDYGSGKDAVSRNFPDVQPLNFNLTAKVGCELNKKINIYAGYNPASSLNDDEGYELKLISYYAGINYLFSK